MYLHTAPPHGPSAGLGGRAHVYIPLTLDRDESSIERERVCGWAPVLLPSSVGLLVLKQLTTALHPAGRGEAAAGGSFARSSAFLLSCASWARARPGGVLLHPRCARLPFCCVASGTTTDARRYRAGRRDGRGVCCDASSPLFTLVLQRHMDHNARICRLLGQCPMRAAKGCIVHHQC